MHDRSTTAPVPSYVYPHRPLFPYCKWTFNLILPSRSINLICIHLMLYGSIIIVCPSYSGGAFPRTRTITHSRHLFGKGSALLINIRIMLSCALINCGEMTNTEQGRFDSFIDLFFMLCSTLHEVATGTYRHWLNGTTQPDYQVI